MDPGSVKLTTKKKKAQPGQSLIDNLEVNGDFIIEKITYSMNQGEKTNSLGKLQKRVRMNEDRRHKS